MSAENPPAFPSPETEKYFATEGMSLRDYFAAKALSGILSDRKHRVRLVRLGKERGFAPGESIAKYCYGAADAMLEERAK